MNGLPRGSGAPRRPDAPLPAVRPNAAAPVEDAAPAGAQPPLGDQGRANACTRLKAYLQNLPKSHKGFAYLYAAVGGAGTGAKVGAVFTLGHPVGTGTMSAAYAILALVAQATKDKHEGVSNAIMNLEGLTSEAAGTAMKSGPWGLRFVMWTLQSAEVIEQAKLNGLNDLQTASLAGFSGGFAVLTHTLVIAAMIDMISSADKMVTRTFGGALEAAGTPLRTVAPVNWAQSVTFGFAQPAILGWAAVVATGNTDMLIGGAAKWLTRSVAESVVVQSGTIATILFTAGTGYAINRGDKFAPIKIDSSMLDELRALSVPLLVSGLRMPRVSLIELAPSPNTCKQVMLDLAQGAFSPPVLFGIATFVNYYLAKNPAADVMGLFNAADTGTQPPVDGGDDIHRVAGRVLVSTLPYAAGWILELVKGWDLSRSPAGVQKLDEITPTRLGDLEQIMLSVMTAGSVAWTTELLAPDAGEAMGMERGLGVLLSVLVPFSGVMATALVASNSKRLAADAAVTLGAGVLGALEPDMHGKEIMLGALGLWMGGRAFVEWSTGNHDRIAAAVAGSASGPAGPGAGGLPPPMRLAQVTVDPMMTASPFDDGTPESSETGRLLNQPRAEAHGETYSEAAVETRRMAISSLMGLRYGRGANLPGDGARSSSGAGIVLPAGTTMADWTERVNRELGPPPWETQPKRDAVTTPPLELHIDGEQVRQHLDDARKPAETAPGDKEEVSIHMGSTGTLGSDSEYEDEAFSMSRQETSRTGSESRSETMTTAEAATPLRTAAEQQAFDRKMRALAESVTKMSPARAQMYLKNLQDSDRDRLLAEIQKISSP